MWVGVVKSSALAENDTQASSKKEAMKRRLSRYQLSILVVPALYIDYFLCLRLWMHKGYFNYYTNTLFLSLLLLHILTSTGNIYPFSCRDTLLLLAFSIWGGNDLMFSPGEMERFKDVKHQYKSLHCSEEPCHKFHFYIFSMSDSPWHFLIIGDCPQCIFMNYKIYSSFFFFF